MPNEVRALLAEDLPAGSTVIYAGMSVLEFDEFRAYQAGKWSEWSNDSAKFSTAFPDISEVTVRDVDGKWLFGENGQNRFIAAMCSQLPS
jgi:hypothetical protein